MCARTSVSPTAVSSRVPTRKGSETRLCTLAAPATRWETLSGRYDAGCPRLGEDDGKRKFRFEVPADIMPGKNLHFPYCNNATRGSSTSSSRTRIPATRSRWTSCGLDTSGGAECAREKLSCCSRQGGSTQTSGPTSAPSGSTTGNTGTNPRRRRSTARHAHQRPQKERHLVPRPTQGLRRGADGD